MFSDTKVWNQLPQSSFRLEVFVPTFHSAAKTTHRKRIVLICGSRYQPPIVHYGGRGLIESYGFIYNSTCGCQYFALQQKLQNGDERSLCVVVVQKSPVVHHNSSVSIAISGWKIWLLKVVKLLKNSECRPAKTFATL